MMKKSVQEWLKKRNVKLCLTGMAIVLLAVGATYAWWTASIEMKQEVTMGKLRIAANFAELDDPVDYEPDVSAEVDGMIINEGSIPAMVKVSNSSQIKFMYADDNLTLIPSAERKYVEDLENAIGLTFRPTSEKYEDNDEVYWFSDGADQLYVLMEVGAQLKVTIETNFDGNVMGNKYQEASIKTGGLLRATQVLDGALTHEFGITNTDLKQMRDSNGNARSKRSVSKGEVRLQELVSRKGGK